MTEQAVDETKDPLTKARENYLDVQSQMRDACGSRERHDKAHEILGTLIEAQLDYSAECSAAGTTPAADLDANSPDIRHVWRSPGEAPIGTGPYEQMPTGVSFSYGTVPA